MADAPKPAPKPEAKYEPRKELPQAAAVQKFQGRPKRQPVEQAEYFYNVKGTHIAFFVASAGMLVSFLMMFNKDVDRPWKPYQKQFAEMDFEKLWVDMNRLEDETRKHDAAIGAIDAKLTQFYAAFDKKPGKEMAADTFNPLPAKVADLEKKLGISFDKVHVIVDPETVPKKLYERKPFVEEKEKIRGELYARTQAMNFAKDDQGAARFRYEDAKHHLEEAVKSGSDRKGFYEHEFEQEQKEYARVLQKVADEKARYDELQKWDEFYEDFAAQLELKAPAAIWSGPSIDSLKKDRIAKVKDYEDKKNRFEKERPSFANTVRNAPGADFFAPTLKVKQHILLDLKDQLNFAQVTKVDRCDTCHVGIGNPVYQVRVNSELGDDSEDKVVFKDATLRDFVAHARGKVEADKCLICKGHESKELKTPLTPHKSWSSDDAIKFTKVFMAHPRLDLFVSDSAKHPVDKIGCTICHEGDGRDTDFTRVVHTPNSREQGQKWRARHGTPYGEEQYNWNYRELWDLPMFPTQCVQASCRRCHTDAVELDGGEKYVEGMKLVERVGCYGCHRVDTYQILDKDLKNPAIDANRKNRRPGPPLLRIATKVSPEWAAKWVMAPRDFRPTTRMPHFFKQSNCRETVAGNRYPVEE